MENIFFDKRDLKYCGEGVIIGKTVRIRRPQEVVIGDHVIIDDFAYIPCALEVGSYTHIGASCSMIGGSGKITIGSFVNIAPSCQIITASNDYKGGGLVGPAIPEEFADKPILKPVVIEDYVLLGCNTSVLPGAILPEGMATGAFSLVREQEYRPWSLYVGVPCQLHCPRDGREIKRKAENLLQLAGEISWRINYSDKKDNDTPPPPPVNSWLTHFEKAWQTGRRNLCTPLKYSSLLYRGTS